jgi:hypothetical protein
MSKYENGDDRRRVVEAQTSVTKAIEARKKRLQQPPAVPPKNKQLSSEAQLERQIYLANLAMNKYQVRLEDGDELNPEEERVFMSLMDAIRKLEATISGLRAKRQNEQLGPVEIAKGLVETGMEVEDVLNMYPGNEAVKRALEKL